MTTPAAPPASESLLALVIHECLADGRIDETDRRLITRISLRLGLPAAAVKSVLERCGEARLESEGAPRALDGAALLHDIEQLVISSATPETAATLMADLTRILVEAVPTTADTLTVSVPAEAAVEPAPAEPAPEAELALTSMAIATPVPPLPGFTERRGVSPSLEVEVSFAAGLLASTAALAYFLFEYARTTGFDSHVDLYFFVLCLTVLEVFDIGLAFHLLQRGVWMAGRLVTRNDPTRWDASVEGAQQFRDSIQGLEQQARATFHASMSYLLEGLVFLTGMLGLWLAADAKSSPGLGLVGLGILGIFVVYSVAALPGRFSRRWREGLGARLQGFSSAFGVRWARPPASRLRLRTPRYSFLTVFGTLFFYGINLGMVFEPVVTLEREIYHQGEDHLAILHFRHGGLRGRAGKHVAARCIVDGKHTVRVEQLALNHFVAAIPLDPLPPGLHEVAFTPVFQQVVSPESAEDYTVDDRPIRLCFFVTRAKLETPAAD